jgi:excisionase family DNA binding protein
MEYLTDQEVADRFGKSKAFVQRMCQAKQWPPMRIGKSYRFKTEHVAAIEALCEVKPAVAPGKTWGLAPGSKAAS